MKNKGFIMAEALIVSAVVLTTLVLIYSQFAKINKNYGESYFYDNINDIYALKRIESFLEDDSIQNIYNDLSTYLDITNCNSNYYVNKSYCTLLYESSNLKNLLITLNDNDYVYNDIYESNQYSLNMLNYIKYFDDSDIEYSYRLIGEFNDGTYASIPVGNASIMKDKTWFDAIAADNIAKNDILSITTQDYIYYNGIYNKVYDVSFKGNDKVRAYLIDTETTGKYNIVLAANGGVYANPDSSELFRNFQYLDRLDLSKFDTSKVTDMGEMFRATGNNSTTFTLDLGDKFDTSKVEDMNNMFNATGYSSTTLTLDLGDKFDTSKVKDMNNMFRVLGYSSTVFTLDLGDKFDTSNVEDMNNMFYATGIRSAIFTLDLGDKFDTSKVEDMSYMFNRTGVYSTVFTLDLGDKFDTSKVTNMEEMFTLIGRETNNLEIDISEFSFALNPTVTNFFGTSRTYATTFYVKDAAAKTYLGTPPNNVIVTIKP